MVLYSVRNDSPLDLTSVIVHRPEVDSRMIYPVSTADGSQLPDGDEVDIGPIPSSENRTFHLLTGGAAPSPIPDLRVVIDCTAEDGGHWRLAPILLDSPWRRPPPVIRGPS